MISDIARVIPEKKFEKKSSRTGVNGTYVLAILSDSVSINMIFYFKKRKILFSLNNLPIFLPFPSGLNSIALITTHHEKISKNGWIWKLGYFHFDIWRSCFAFLAQQNQNQANISEKRQNVKWCSCHLLLVTLVLFTKSPVQFWQIRTSK